MSLIIEFFAFFLYTQCQIYMTDLIFDQRKNCLKRYIYLSILNFVRNAQRQLLLEFFFLLQRLKDIYLAFNDLIY